MDNIGKVEFINRTILF